MTGKSLENIITKCKAQERSAQKELYEFTYVHLVTTVALFTKDAQEKDWVFNLGMLKVFQSIENYKSGTNYLGWARVILKRTAIDQIRKNKNYNELHISMELNDQNTTGFDLNDSLSKLETDELIVLIQQLPENERLIFTLYEIEGYSHKEIETEYQIKSNTSKWLLAKSKANLRKKLIQLSPPNYYSNEK